MSQVEHMETDGNPEKQPATELEEPSRSPSNARLQQQAAEQHGLRSSLLNGAFDKVLQYGLQDPSREEFGEHFPSLDVELLDALYDAYKQALALVRSHCQEEYQLICSEQQVLDHLRALDKLDDVQQQQQQQPTPAATPLGGVQTPGMTPLGGVRTTPSRRAAAAAAANRAPSEAVVRDAEAAARRYTLRQEAAHLQHMLEKARMTENRLSLTLAMRKDAVQKMATTYEKAVADVKQVYDITRAWPTAPRPGASD